MVMIPMAAAGAAAAESSGVLAGGSGTAEAESGFSIFQPQDGDAQPAAEPLLFPAEAAVDAAADVADAAAAAGVTGEPEITAPDPQTVTTGLVWAAALESSEAVFKDCTFGPTATADLPKTREEVIREAELEVCEIGLEIHELRSTIECSKKRLKHILEDLDEASQKLNDLREGKEIQLDLPLAEGAKPAAEGKTGAVAEIISDSPAATQVPPANAPLPTDDAWRKVSVEALGFDKIKGFGKKKRESLLEVAPTLGSLEDLRAQAGPMGLQSVLPDGFGEKICSEIENKIIEWLSANRDETVLTAAAEGAEAAVPQDYPAIADGVELSGDTDTAVPVDGADIENAQKLARADELKAESALQPVQAQYGEIFNDGRACAMNDGAITDCNWTAGDKQDSWLLGYLSMKPQAKEVAQSA